MLLLILETFSLVCCIVSLTALNIVFISILFLHKQYWPNTAAVCLLAIYYQWSSVIKRKGTPFTHHQFMAQSAFPRQINTMLQKGKGSSTSSSSCGLSRAGRCRSYELAPCLSILRSVLGGC